jgi:hypothetical protein
LLRRRVSADRFHKLHNPPHFDFLPPNHPSR